MTGSVERVFCFQPADPPSQQLLAVSLFLQDWSSAESDLKIEIPKSVFEALTPEEFKRLFSDLILERSASATNIEISVTGDSCFRISRGP